jgi:hypothetical protein
MASNINNIYYNNKEMTKYYFLSISLKIPMLLLLDLKELFTGFMIGNALCLTYLFYIYYICNKTLVDIYYTNRDKYILFQ